MPSPSRLRAAAAAAVAALAALLPALLVACGGDPTPPAARPPRPDTTMTPTPPASTPAASLVRSVRIEPRGVTLELADTVRMRATALDSAGREVPGARVTWSTDLSGGIRVDSTGLVRAAEQEGSFRVVARVDSVTDVVPVAVRGRISLFVWPDTSVLLPGMSRALAARRWDADSNGIATLDGAAWASSDAGVASVDGAGRVVAVGPGRATITATRGDRRASAVVHVLAGRAPLRFAEVRPGILYTCARTVDGEAYCWGVVSSALGTVGPTDRCEEFGHTPSRIPRSTRTTYRCAAIPLPVEGGVRFAALAEGTSCGLTADGAVWCWGQLGGLGPGTGETPLPVRVAGLPPMRQLSGRCGVSVDGEILCWGDGRPGEPPTRVAPPATGRWTRVAVSDTHRCAIDSEGTAHCWRSSNEIGELGRGSLGSPCTFDRPGECAVPRPVATSDRFATIGVGTFTSCGLRADGRAICWGYGAGQPRGPEGPLPRVATPTEAPAPEPLVSLALRGYQTCGLGASGATYCWGLDVPGAGRPGLGQDVFARMPLPVALRTVDSGGYHACGLATDGLAWCWGAGIYEAWGIGVLRSPSGAPPAPRPVVGQ